MHTRGLVPFGHMLGGKMQEYVDISNPADDTDGQMDQIP